MMGDGSAAPSVVMSFSGGVLNFDRMVVAGSLLKLFTKAGAINDGDIPGYFTGAGSGSIGINTNTNEIYFRSGSNWRKIASVAA
jgi:hypothetical protein